MFVEIDFGQSGTHNSNIQLVNQLSDSETLITNAFNTLMGEWSKQN